MDSRQSVNVVMGISLTIFIVLATAGFITTIVFFSQRQRAIDDLEELRASQETYIRETEKGSSRVTQAVQEAGNRSVVDHLLTVNSQLASLAVGTPNASLEEIQRRAEDRGGVESGSMLSRIQQLETSLTSLERTLEEERRLRQSAQADAEAEAARIRTIEREAQRAVEQAQSQVEAYASDIAEFRSSADRTAQNLSRQAETTRDRLETQIADRDTRISEQIDEIARLRDALARARGDATTGSTIRPVDEFALVDGTIVGVDAVDDEVVISLGRGDKLVLGMKFVVFSEVGDIRPDPETGEYAPGKAVIEVSRIDRDTARARVIDQVAGNPPVRGDIIANAVYDPDKVYNFVVEGYFDTNQDGVVTRFERDQLVGLIERWGGRVVDELQGDTDFLVLGERPALPPEPPSDAPVQVFQRYVDIQREIGRYDELFETAAETSIPVLNTNRLRTLVGDLSTN